MAKDTEIRLLIYHCKFYRIYIRTISSVLIFVFLLEKIYYVECWKLSLHLVGIQLIISAKILAVMEFRISKHADILYFQNSLTNNVKIPFYVPYKNVRVLFALSIFDFQVHLHLSKKYPKLRKRSTKIK